MIDDKKLRGIRQSMYKMLGELMKIEADYRNGKCPEVLYKLMLDAYNVEIAGHCYLYLKNFKSNQTKSN